MVITHKLAPVLLFAFFLFVWFLYVYSYQVCVLAGKGKEGAGRRRVSAQQLFIQAPVLRSKLVGSKTHEGRLGDTQAVVGRKKGDYVLYFCNPFAYFQLVEEPLYHKSVLVGIRVVGYAALMPYAFGDLDCLRRYCAMYTGSARVSTTFALKWNTRLQSYNIPFVTWRDVYVHSLPN